MLENIGITLVIAGALLTATKIDTKKAGKILIGIGLSFIIATFI